MSARLEAGECVERDGRMMKGQPVRVGLRRVQEDMHNRLHDARQEHRRLPPNRSHLVGLSDAVGQQP